MVSDSVSMLNNNKPHGNLFRQKDPPLASISAHFLQTDHTLPASNQKHRHNHPNSHLILPQTATQTALISRSPTHSSTARPHISSSWRGIRTWISFNDEESASPCQSISTWPATGQNRTGQFKSSSPSQASNDWDPSSWLERKREDEDSKSLAD